MVFDPANRTGRTVVGLFRERRDAEQAIGDLRDAGFTREQIGIAINDKTEQTEQKERKRMLKASSVARLEGVDERRREVEPFRSAADGSPRFQGGASRLGSQRQRATNRHEWPRCSF